jgi:TetR/AcrR family transcriptional regulator
MSALTAREGRATRPRRNASATRRRILDAARAEFAAHGYAGARVDAIAQRAGSNKRMLYAYVGDKRALFAETLRRKLRERAGLLDRAPDRLEDALPQWADAAAEDPTWVRLVTWEALEHGAAPTAARAERREEFEAVRRWLERRGRLDPSVPADQALLAGIAVAVFPVAFPQVAELITGSDPEGEEFRDAHRAFLRDLGARLAGRDEEAAR